MPDRATRGELELARTQAEHLLDLAQRSQDSTLLLQAHVALGTPSLFLGSLGLAYEHFTQGSLLYDPHRHHTLVAVYGLDPGVFCGSYTATEVLGTLDQPGERLWDAELYRLKGELTLARSGVQRLTSRSITRQKAKGKR